MNPTSKIVAFSNILAFALQIALALLMLRHFSPEEVGEFSVISQIGFFWTILALAQAPLQLLVNKGTSVLVDTRLAWFSCVKRFMWLLPIAAFAVRWSGLPFVSTLLWALSMSLCQLTWMLGQSMRLRLANVSAQAAVRVLPPLVALLVAMTTTSMHWNLPALLTAVLLGYASGAIWLLPVVLVSRQHNSGNTTMMPDDLALSPALQAPSCSSIPVPVLDNRSVALRMAHTLADALLATSVVSVWQRSYGAEETGWLAAPLRLLAFLPAVVHMACAQVMLAQPHSVRTSPLVVGFGGFVSVALLGAGCAIALEMGWLGEQWGGIQPYLLPLVLWQGSACIAAALSHAPFESNFAQRYSWICISLATIQGLVLYLPIAFYSAHITSKMHVEFFCFTSSLGLIVMSFWLQQISHFRAGKQTEA